MHKIDTGKEVKIIRTTFSDGPFKDNEWTYAIIKTAKFSRNFTNEKVGPKYGRLKCFQNTYGTQACVCHTHTSKITKRCAGK